MSLAIYNFAQSWTPPTSSAPGGNVAQPINVGSATQDKVGTLGVDNLNVWQNTQIYNAAPTVLFNDSDHRNFWQHVNSNTMYIIGDRDDNGNWATDYPWPLELRLGATAGSDVAKFSNDVWAARYCDANGANCAPAGGGGGGYNNCHWSGYIGQWGGGTTLICPANGIIKGFGIEDNSLDVAAVRIYCCSVGPSTPLVTGNWQTGSWGAWSFRFSGRCGNPRPTQTRSVTCRSSLDNSILPDSVCGLSSKPQSSRMDMSACSGD